MTKLNKYKAFGLNIASSFEIPELMVSDKGDVTVTIEYGMVPEKIANPLSTGARFQANEQEFILTVDKIGRFYVHDGKTIVVSKYPGAADEEIRLFLLGSTLGALFHQRGLLPLHASTIDLGKEAIALCGVSGAGKSTLAASFIKAGYKLMADDISVITFRNKAPVVNPAYPQMKLWADAVKHFGDNPESYQKIRKNLEKHGVKFHNEFSNEPRSLRHIFVLVVKNSPGFEVEKLTGAEKFKAIHSNTYRFNFTKGMGARADHLQQSSMLASKVRITRIIRPRKGYFGKELMEIIQQQLGK